MVPGCFTQELLKELHSNIYNSYTDNYDIDSLGPLQTTIRQRISRQVKGFLLKRKLLPRNDVATLFSAIQPLVWFFHRFEVLYDSLADVESRYLLVQVVAFRVLGHEKVRLPLNNVHFWKQRDVLRNLMDTGDTFVAGHYRMCLFDLYHIGYAIKLYSPPTGPQPIFLLKQYEYRSEAVHIKAEQGDVVIDAGGCWGDTALYFAYEVGETGQVYSVEFINSNLKIMEKNLQLNNALRKRIKIVERPLWSKPDVALYFKDHGPSSRGALEVANGDEESVRHTTTTIDAMVEQNRLSKVDFIKMDVESAEPEALRGAEKTMRQFRPKLAISVYHSVSDFVDVFEFVSSLNLGYKFYLGHYTMHWHETVLFAVIDGVSREF